jgi:hypothetical protein
MGWILRGALPNETVMLSRYVPDLERDRFYRRFAVWYWLPIALAAFVLRGCGAAAGGRLGFRGCCGECFSGPLPALTFPGSSTQ